VYNHSTYWKTVKFITDNLFLIAISLISAGALFFPGLQRRGARVTQLQATQYMNQPKTVVLDVRSAEEFASGHLQNAKNIPVAELADKVKELEKSKIQIIITVCETGVRSGNAVSILNKAGFEQAFSLEGGIAAWKSQGLPTIK
jgi:rhodanese-related sulfurtransferase